MLRALGMTRAVDELGRIVIPIDVRRNFGIDTKDMLEIFVDTDKEYIVFHKALRVCIMCGSQENLYQLSNEKYICGDCVKKISKKIDDLNRYEELKTDYADDTDSKFFKLENRGIFDPKK